jgi:serine/threonine protein kinase
MNAETVERDRINYDIAHRWCAARGTEWYVRDQAGRGGTAPVYTVASPQGDLALKIYDAEFSTGEKGKVESKRIDQQVALGIHDCPSLVKVHGGGAFEDRLFLLMNRAPGQELEKCLGIVPRASIRTIVDQVARACMFLREKDLCHRDIKSANIFVSDDFEQATLLDLSVTRDIYDPVGIGTDHDGQLPVVATARYSPPEYLFRLIDPGLDLWHALDIYQLGGLLHDLIMREPLFQNEYARSKENRYRFAWAVAMTEPVVSATDVDQDLVFTARRALDKNWQRRSLLSLDDFLANTETQHARALDALGLSSKPKFESLSSDKANLHSRVAEVATGLRARVQEHLRRQGVTARHYLDPGDDDRSKLLRFEWPSAKGGEIAGDIRFTIELMLGVTSARRVFESDVSLSASVGGKVRNESLNLPAVEDNAGANDRLGEQVEAALGSLASAMMRPSSE